MSRWGPRQRDHDPALVVPCCISAARRRQQQGHLALPAPWRVRSPLPTPPLFPGPQAWAWQRARVAHLSGGSAPAAGSVGLAADTRDTVILLQHPPTFTLGAGSTLANVPFDLGAPPHPIHRTERGGEVTYHGPGQVGAVQAWWRVGARLRGRRGGGVLELPAACRGPSHRLPAGCVPADSGDVPRRYPTLNPPHPPIPPRPGQLVLYPILDLGRHTRDLHWYLRELEEVVLRALDSVSGLQVRRPRPDRTRAPT